MRLCTLILLTATLGGGCRSPAIVEKEPCPPFCPCDAETDCQDGSECTLDYCDDATGSCLSVPLQDGIECDDGLLCTGVDSCLNGVCVGEPLDCTAFDSACRTGECDEGTGHCIAVVAREGETCDDGLFCTSGDICDTGQCRGSPTECDDSDPCTVDTCDEVLAECVFTPAGDRDGDGYLGTICGGSDCDDADPFRHPNVDEVCDFLDNDCDPLNPDGSDEPDLGAACDMAAGAGTRLCLDGAMFCEPDSPLPWTVWDASVVSHWLYDVHSPDGQNLWVVGLQNVYHSTDRGQSWELQAVLEDIDYLEGVYFVSSSEGWVCGRSGFLAHTIDGGMNWTPIASSTSQDLYAIFMLDAATGWAVGANGTVVATVDGSNWAVRSTPTNQALVDVMFVDDQRGWAVGWNAILLTVDGGLSWQSRAVPAEGAPQCVHFRPDGLNGWIGAYPWGGLSSCIMLRTRDGGDNWEVQVLNDQMYCDEVVDIDFLDDQRGYAIEEDGYLFITQDGGESWLYAGYVIDDGTSLHFMDIDTGVVTGRDGEIKVTLDGGATWRNADGAPGYDSFNGLSFHHRRTGWLWSYYDMYRSADGGYTWERRDSGTPAISKVWAFPGDFGLGQASGTSRLVATQDAGLSWEPYPVPFDFSQISVVDRDTLFLVDADNQVIRTLDGGTTWEIVNADVSLTNVVNLEFFDADLGWGRDRYNSDIYLTRDGGASWSLMANPLSDGYVSDLCFTDSLHGWLVSSIGEVARTEDGGLGWTLQDSGGAPSLAGLQCISNLEAWAIGGDLLLHTQDGGDNWEQVASPVSGALQVIFVDDQVGFVLARNQLAVTRTGGQ